jgi:hypothetical protein
LGEGFSRSSMWILSSPPGAFRAATFMTRVSLF